MIIKQLNMPGFTAAASLYHGSEHYLADTVGSNDQQVVEPTLDCIPPELGTPEAAALDTGYFSAANIAACERRAIGPSIATGRDGGSTHT